MTIGIFPAAGGLGGSTYRHLLKIVPNDQVVLISRFPKKIPESYVKAGVEVREAKYEDTPAELEKAFAGVNTLFLISYPSHVHEYRTKVRNIECIALKPPKIGRLLTLAMFHKVHLPAIDAARAAGVKHIFYSSLGFDGKKSGSSLAVVMQAHLDTEKHLGHLAETDSSFTYTVIREGLYSESTPIYTAFFNPKDPQGADEILIPHDGTGPGVCWVKRDELGEGSARLIAKYAVNPATFPHRNSTVTLTGNRELSLAETVEALSKIAGKNVRIKQISVDEYVRLPQVLAKFRTEENARTWATAWDAIRAGETAVVTADLEQILGRKPEEFEETVSHHWA